MLLLKLLSNLSVIFWLILIRFRVELEDLLNSLNRLSFVLLFLDIDSFSATMFEKDLSFVRKKRHKSYINQKLWTMLFFSFRRETANHILCCEKWNMLTYTIKPSHVMLLHVRKKGKNSYENSRLHVWNAIISLTSRKTKLNVFFVINDTQHFFISSASPRNTNKHTARMETMFSIQQWICVYKIWM